MWGNLSDDYSRRVIRNYLCKTEIDIKARRNLPQLNIRAIAAMHRGGINFRREVRFGGMVLNRFLSSKFIIMVLKFINIYMTSTLKLKGSRDCNKETSEYACSAPKSKEQEFGMRE